MYDLLICEDEPVILLGLQKIIRSFDLPIRDIFLAEDGIKALQIFNEKNIHLVITDIEMPGLDGLNFVSRMLKNEDELQCIIISGYDKFAYAQTAIKLGIHDYLLKPIDPQELFNALKNCIEKLAQHRTHERIISNILCSQIEAIWGDLIPEEIYSMLRGTDMTFFTAHSFVYLAFYVDKIPYVSMENAMDRVKEFLSERYAHFLLFPGHGRTFWGVLNIHPEEFPKLRELAVKLNQYLFTCRKEYSMSIYCSISKPAEEIFDLAVVGGEAENEICARLLLADPERRVIALSSKTPEDQELMDKMSSFAESLSIHLKFLSLHNVEKDIDELSSIIRQCFPFNARQVRPFLRMLDHRILEEQDDKSKSGQLFSLIFDCDNIKELESQMKKNLLQFFNQHIKKKQICWDPVSHAIDYMERNYAKQLDLTILANIVSMNYTYFSGIFKKKTGMNVISYLHKIRIRKAKELLVNTDEKINEIARAIGFHDERYFTKIFKRYENMTPSEYRSNLALPLEKV